MDDAVPEEYENGSAMQTSGDGEEQESSYDPMAFYKQQQQEMLLQATQHVQAAQEEIQQAQSQASMQDEKESQQTSGGRRSRSAAAAAKAALSSMNETQRGIDDVVFERPTAIGQHTVSGRGGQRGRPPGTGRGRGRPPGSAWAPRTIGLCSTSSPWRLLRKDTRPGCFYRINLQEH